MLDFLVYLWGVEEELGISEMMMILLLLRWALSIERCREVKTVAPKVYCLPDCENYESIMSK